MYRNDNKCFGGEAGHFEGEAYPSDLSSGASNDCLL